MLMDITRSRLIQAWFATLALVVAFEMTLDARVTMGSAVMLLALCLVPLAIVLTLGTVAHPPTVPEVLHDARSPGVTTESAGAGCGGAPTDEGGFQ